MECVLVAVVVVVVRGGVTRGYGDLLWGGGLSSVCVWRIYIYCCSPQCSIGGRDVNMGDYG